MNAGRPGFPKSDFDVLVEALATATKTARTIAGCGSQPEAPVDLTTTRPVDRENVWRAAEAQRSMRHRRTRLLGEEAAIFGDPGWDILVEAYLAEANATVWPVTSLSYSAGVAPTTSLRWVAILSDRGYLVRFSDPEDGRRTLVRITDAGANLVERCLVAPT